MMKKFLSILLLLLILASCAKPAESDMYAKYQVDFMGLFDTYSVIVGYAKTQDDFTEFGQIIHASLEEQQRYFDIYKTYEGVNNLKTINDQAGIAPVYVDQAIIDLLLFCKDAYYHTDGIVNATMGSVLSIWHDYRTKGRENPEDAQLPTREELEAAVLLTNIDDLVIDEENQTVFLKHEGMSLDVGSIAKGFAAQIAVEKAKEAGLTSVLASIGGNIISVGRPLDSIRDRWGVGIQDPNLSIQGVSNILDTIYVNDISVVSSGSYERYFIVDGKAYSHIIDPSTLMPAERFKEVTVLDENSGLADVLSTAIYILPFEEGKALIEKMGAEALWILPDDSLLATEGYQRISKSLGDYSAVDQ